MSDINKKNNNRMFPGIKGRRPDNYKAKAEEAIERLTAWQALSVKEQIALLDARLGKDVGAKRQRARLQKLLEIK